MAIIRRFPPEYFLKFKEKPVKLKPFNRKQENIAKLYLRKVQQLLKNYNVKVIIRGSTAFKILGKGDIEIGVYPKEVDWDSVVAILTQKFGNPENVEDDYVRFNDLYKSVEVEIIMLKGEEAVQDLKLHKYLKEHPKLLKEYENIKRKYSYSKREYQIQKNIFLSKVAQMISD